MDLPVGCMAKAGDASPRDRVAAIAVKFFVKAFMVLVQLFVALVVFGFSAIAG